MKIALIGYGKMGKAIEDIIVQEGNHEVVLKIGQSNIEEFTVDNLQKVDVAIEFTQPGHAYDHVMKCFEANIPVVVGTTAWLDKLPLVQEQCQLNGKTALVSSNFSIGVNLFFALNRQLAQLMKNHTEYHASIEEIHHVEKKDAPSGTAVSLANDILPILNLDRWSLEEDGKNIPNAQLPIRAIREPHVPGTHSVYYNSDIDEIVIKHTAKSRRGFAIGALRAAEFLYLKKGYYTMQDVIKL